MNGRPVLLALAGLLMALLACTLPSSIPESLAPGGTWYVTMAGSDANDCLSVATACATVKAAVVKAAIGGVIEIGPGDFSVSDPSFPGRGLNLGNKVLTLRGMPGSGGPATTLDGSGTDLAVWINGLDTSGVLILENLIIQGGSRSALAIYVEKPAAAGVNLHNVIIQGSGSDGISTTGPVVLQLDGVRVLNNSGIGISMNSFTELTITGSTISGNASGGLSVAGGNTAITDSTISDNGTPSGAQVVLGSGPTRIERSTISHARTAVDCHPYFAVACGTGLLSQATLTIVNSTIAANSATGIISYGNLDMIYSTVAGNGASGLDVERGAATLAQDIVENNTGRDCIAARDPALIFTWNPFILSDGTCSPSIYILASRGVPDPYLGPLADNGGPTQTMAILSNLSPAVNPVTGGGPVAPPTDQSGRPRPAPDGGGPDAGAYEFTLARTSLVIPPATPTAEIAVPPSPTPGQGTLILILEKNANCRNGPGTAFDAVDAYLAGQSLVVDGRNEDVPWWWQVQMPHSKKHCWVSSVAGTPQGDFSQLPIDSAPAAPSPGNQVIDYDKDGYPAGSDCNDKNLNINPGAVETPDDKVDSNCNGDDDK